MSLIHTVADIFNKREGITSSHPNWRILELDRTCKVQNGFPLKSNLFNKEGIGVPIIRIRDIVKSEPITFYSGDFPEEYIVHSGDLLIGMDGDFNSELWKGPEAVLNQRVCRIFVNEKLLNPKFLYYGIGGYLKKINDNTSSTTVKHLSSKSIKEIPFPLPPLPEQNRIVTQLDKLFKQLEEIKGQIVKLNVIKERFLYNCLVNNQSKQFFSRQKIGGYLEERSERIGKNWKSSRKIGVSAKKGIIELSTGQKMTFDNYKIVKPGDFIYNTMRVNIGSIAIYTGKDVAITSPDYVVFRVKHFLSSELLLGFLKSDQGLLEIGANTKGSVRARLYFKSLSEIRMPISGEETQILAQKFLSSFSISLRKLKKISKTKFVDLEKAILNKAFKGELVPQLESDGHARELLEEIRQLKEKDSAKAVKGKAKIKKYETGEVELSIAAEGIEHKFVRKNKN